VVRGRHVTHFGVLEAETDGKALKDAPVGAPTVILD
jgi:hypothetical protein